MTTLRILQECKKAKAEVALLTAERKNQALFAMADKLESNAEKILCANALDLQEAKGVISDVMLDRLALNGERIKAMADGVRQVARLADPVGETLGVISRADGLEIKKISVPLGVIAIIYESRPNVTSDSAALALKSGNVCVLRTGKEAHRSAGAIVCAMREGLAEVGITVNAIGFLEDTSREGATELMRANGYVDLLIPRGGAGLIKACVQNATVPCIETGTGICHTYVDASADLSVALKVIENAKCSRPSVCNAMEVCLVDGKIYEEFLRVLWQRLVADRATNPVTLVCDERAYSVLQGKNGCVPAGAGDFDTEFLDYKMAVAVVDGADCAIAHISEHSTGHSDCIIATDENTIGKFVNGVDSAAVYVNASTRFTDGGEFGLGCEIGISTQKLHARGPLGLKELTSCKYVVKGNGNIR